MRSDPKRSGVLLGPERRRSARQRHVHPKPGAYPRIRRTYIQTNQRWVGLHLRCNDRRRSLLLGRERQWQAREWHRERSHTSPRHGRSCFPDHHDGAVPHLRDRHERIGILLGRRTGWRARDRRFGRRPNPGTCGGRTPFQDHGRRLGPYVRHNDHGRGVLLGWRSRWRAWQWIARLPICAGRGERQSHI